MVQGEEEEMSEWVKLIDRNSAVEAIQKLCEEDLRFLNRLIVERLKWLHQAKSMMEMAKFSVGDRVSFWNSAGNFISGVVHRLNKKTITIVADGGMQWNVSPGLLNRDGKAWGEAKPV
ncbi:MAG: hypothetical protein V1913_01935 [Fibrobacterota bacterium]